MGRRKKNPITPEKQELFTKLIETYEIQTVKDLEEALFNLFDFHF